MKSKRVLSFKTLFAIAAVTVFVCASAASTQTERRVDLLINDSEQARQADPGKGAAASKQTERRMSAATIQAGTVTAQSPTVSLNEVGREVARGVFEVDPGSIIGKRLTMPRGDQTLRFVCIGKWKNGECKGIYIEW